MLVRHAVLASIMFTALLAGCNKRDEAPATPPATDASSAAPAPAMPTPPAIAPPPAAPATPPADAGGTGDKKP